MFVELHLIQNFGPSCLNRDDTNTPKDCQFGGFRRARISSQCLKRAIRTYFKSNINEKLGVRTRMLPRKVIGILVQNGKPEDSSTEIVGAILEKIGFTIDKVDKGKTDVLLFINHDLPEEVARLILENWNSFSESKLSKEAVKLLDSISKKIQNELDIDIALFGRMVASKTDLKVDSACYVAHAISTHKVDMEMDFFTAIDDLQAETESGAGMMGVIMYNSSCFYRYSVVDFNQLKSNLNNNREVAISTLKGFIEASINAIPTGKQTSMAAFNRPDFIMATLRKDQPCSLINSFTKPVKVGIRDEDIVTQSIVLLDSYLKDLSDLYGASVNTQHHFCHAGERPIAFINSVGIYYKSINDMIGAIGEALSGSSSSST